MTSACRSGKQRFGGPLVILSLALVASGSVVAEDAKQAPAFAPEFVHDTSVHSDESLVNVKVRNNRWVDCHTLQTITNDIFRVEGVNKTRGESPAKAMALWKWFRILICNSVPHSYEGPYKKAKRQREPHKSMTVYGHHECGGLSAPMAALWRAAGFIGYKESSHGHSTVALRYPDEDGVWRIHCFDPMGGFYWWDETNKRIGVRSCPVMQRTVFRRLEPVSDHTLRTSLRWGETVRRQWYNGKIVLKTAPKVSSFIRDLVHECAAGLEVQVLEADTTAANYGKALWKDSTNTACSDGGNGSAALHPKEAGKPATFIYRVASPYVAVQATCEASLVKNAETDVCRLSFSIDLGKTWHPFFEMQKTGKEEVNVDIGNGPYVESKPSVTSNYTFLVKAEFKTDGNPSSVGMNKLKVTVKRQLNKRMLMNLMPGENMVEVAAEKLAPGMALQLEINYIANAKPVTITKTIDTFPFYFPVKIEGVSSDHLKTMRSKVTRFNIPAWPLRMGHLKMRLVDAEGVKKDASLPAQEGQAAYAKATPHPFVPKRTRKTAKVPKHDSEVSGFLPQLPKPEKRELSEEEKKKYDELAKNPRRWSSAEALGAYPQSVEVLSAALRRSDGDQTIYICKSLARIADKKAMPMLKYKWARFVRSRSGGPGVRYVPDVIAAIGDRSMVPELLKPLRKVRCDYRFHIAHALGVLGGPEATRALEDLAKNDPHYAIRELAKSFLKK